MCMTNVQKVDDKDLPSHAYKVCRGNFIGPFTFTRRVDGVWMEAVDEPDQKDPILYTPGFHVFLSKQVAISYQIRLYPYTKQGHVVRVEIQGPAHSGRTAGCGLTGYSVAKIKFPKRVQIDKKD